MGTGLLCLEGCDFWGVFGGLVVGGHKKGCLLCVPGFVVIKERSGTTRGSFPTGFSFLSFRAQRGIFGKINEGKIPRGARDDNNR